MARLPKACPQCGCLGECHSRWILFYEFEPLIYIAVITLLIFGPVFAFMAGYSAGKDSVRCEAVKLGPGIGVRTSAARRCFVGQSVRNENGRSETMGRENYPAGPE